MPEITAEWMRDQTAQQELEATIEAAAHALLQWASDVWLLVTECPSPEAAIDAALASPVLSNDLMRVERLRQKLWQARVNLSETVLPTALSILRADGASEEIISFITKVLKTLIAGYSAALDQVMKNQRRVTVLAETMIALRAEVGDYTVEDELSDYGYAQTWVYSLRPRKPAQPEAPADLEQWLDEIIK
jgi:hypothetical protein